MNRAAQVGALAALEDQAWLGEVLARVERGRDRIAAIVSQAGFTALPSATNFVTVDCGAEVERAKAVLDSLVARGIFIRMPFVAPQNRCVRISVGTKGELDQLEVEIQNLPSTFTNRS